MHRVSVVAYRFRAALSGAVGALVFVLPTTPGPAPAAHTGLTNDRATEVMPPASNHIAPNTGLFATACTGPGFCTAGGDYQDASKPVEPVVATQTNGRWSRGVRLLLPQNASKQPYSEVNGIACISAGNCVAVGDYEYGESNTLQAFIAIQVHGKWGRAFVPRLPGSSSAPASAQLNAVTCTHSGFCEAVGSFQDSSGSAQVLALSKLASGGGWSPAAGIAAPPNAAANPDAVMTGIACTGPGSCVAVGNYSVSASQYAAMGAIESRGTWHRASEIVAPRNAIPSTFTAMSAISCLPNGSCLGVGEYPASATQSRAMSVTEANGRFGRATEIAAVPRGASIHPSTYLLGVSCAPAGMCLAVGGGRDKAGHPVAMYMTLQRGIWSAAFLPPPPRAGTGSHELSALYSVSGTGRDEGTAVGYYHDSTGAQRAEAASTG
jgi:hypothetical protein